MSNILTMELIDATSNEFYSDKLLEKLILQRKSLFNAKEKEVHCLCCGSCTMTQVFDSLVAKVKILKKKGNDFTGTKWVKTEESFYLKPSSEMLNQLMEFLREGSATSSKYGQAFLNMIADRQIAWNEENYQAIKKFSQKSHDADVWKKIGGMRMLLEEEMERAIDSNNYKVAKEIANKLGVEIPRESLEKMLQAKSTD